MRSNEQSDIHMSASQKLKAGDTRSRGWVAAWILCVAVVVLTTTLPWSDISGQPQWGKMQWFPFYGAVVSRRHIFDIVVNVVLFVPFGYSYTRASNRPPAARFLFAVLFGGVLSAGAEFFQLFAAHRFPSMTDVCMNMLGTAGGAAFAMSSNLLARSRS